MTDEKEAPKGEKATDELAEAAKHVKHAAQIFFDRASKDPTLKAAAAEAERLVEKVGAGAEPLAKQLASELGKLGRAIAHNLEGAAKKTEPPADPTSPAAPDAAEPAPAAETEEEEKK